MVLGATSAAFGSTSSTKTVNVCYALGARSDGKIRFTTDIDYTNCGSSTVFDIIGINVIATGAGSHNMDLTGNPGVSSEMTVKAGSYTFSYSGFDPTLSMGCGCGPNCTTCYDDITKVTFSPSSVTVPQGGTKDVKITYGCAGGGETGTGTIIVSCQGEGDYVADQCDYVLYNHDTGDEFEGTWYADDGDIYIDDAPIGTYTVTSPHGGRVCDRSGSCAIRVTATTPKPAQFTLTANKVQSVSIVLNYDTWQLGD